jgi:hypothetical protein
MNKSKQERSDGGDAFIPESAQITGTKDDLAEILAEDYLRDASGDETEEERDEEVPEELGGPFVESRAEAEFGPDREDTKDPFLTEGPRQKTMPPLRSPLPQAVGSLAIAAPDEDVEDVEDEGTESNPDEPMSASVREANLTSESRSTMEPDIRIDSPASAALKT